MSNLNRPGIYIIRGPGGKVYIGSARNIRARWQRHRIDLNNGNSRSTHLLRAWQNYGGDKLFFGVIEFVDDADKLLAREQYWLDWVFKTHPRNQIYNMVEVAGRTTGYKHTAESKARMSAAKQNNPKVKAAIAKATSASMEIRQNKDYGNSVAFALSGGKTYTLVSPDGTVYENVYSLMQFAKEHGLKDMGLRRIVNRGGKPYKGWTGYISNKQKNT